MILKSGVPFPDEITSPTPTIAKVCKTETDVDSLHYVYCMLLDDACVLHLFRNKIYKAVPAPMEPGTCKAKYSQMDSFGARIQTQGPQKSNRFI